RPAARDDPGRVAAVPAGRLVAVPGRGDRLQGEPHRPAGRDRARPTRRAAGLAGAAGGAGRPVRRGLARRRARRRGAGTPAAPGQGLAPVPGPGTPPGRDLRGAGRRRHRYLGALHPRPPAARVPAGARRRRAGRGAGHRPGGRPAAVPTPVSGPVRRGRGPRRGAARPAARAPPTQRRRTVLSWKHNNGGSAALPTLVLGAGHAGQAVVRALRETPGYGLNPIGFLDDNPRLRRVRGLRVLGRLDDLTEVAREMGARAALVAIPSLPPGRIAEQIERAASAGLLVRHLPSFLAAVERDLRVSDLRSVRVDELLGRDEVHLASARAQSLIRGRRVLVTGAGGSIGSELCRQVRRFHPAALYLLDHDESNLHGLHLEITGSGLLDSDEILIADIRDRRRLAQVFALTRPELVFHAAAHKHLPLLERHPCEGVKSNVLGTQHLVELSVQHGVERFVLISTDKAADPTSVLGATKRLAELVVQGAAGGPTCMASVRFGNVLGSRGSLLSVLAAQVA